MIIVCALYASKGVFILARKSQECVLSEHIQLERMPIGHVVP